MGASGGRHARRGRRACQQVLRPPGLRLAVFTLPVPEPQAARETSALETLVPRDFTTPSRESCVWRDQRPQTVLGRRGMYLCCWAGFRSRVEAGLEILKDAHLGVTGSFAPVRKIPAHRLRCSLNEHVCAPQSAVTEAGPALPSITPSALGSAASAPLGPTH